MNKHINWVDEVAEYKNQYDDEDGIHEYIDSLVPIYYHDITNAFWQMTSLITDDDVGLPIWQVMTKHIYEAYFEAFMNEWDGFDEEE